MNANMKQVALIIILRTLFLFGAICLNGCASTYGNLVSGSNLGAQEYQPAVLVNPGMDNDYQRILGICRNAAVSRQITSAQEAQLKSITGMTSGAVTGAVKGMEMGSIFKEAGLGTSINKSAGLGLVGGLLMSAGSSFSSGTNHAAAETKRILLSCLRLADQRQQFYKVIE